MISKEEIEKAIDKANWIQSKLRNEGIRDLRGVFLIPPCLEERKYPITILTTYINQLETREEKLIDKLKKDITTSEIECRNREMFGEDVHGHIKYKTINNYAREILSILKGE